jgi:hypothetical protein
MTPQASEDLPLPFTDQFDITRDQNAIQLLQDSMESYSKCTPEEQRFKTLRALFIPQTTKTV